MKNACGPAMDPKAGRLTREGVLRALAGQLRGAPDGQDTLLPVDGLPEALGDVTALQLMKDL